MKRMLPILLLALLAGTWWWLSRPVRRPPGVVAPAAPRQTSVTVGTPFNRRGYAVRPLARFQLRARVLSARRYWLDRDARVSPLDLALGWGRMSDSKVLKDIKISQYNRFYFWRVKSFPIPEQELCRSSANMHIIPGNSAVGWQLWRIRRGHVVEIDGYLVKVTGKKGYRWISSMSRADTGRGACEVVWVDKLTLH